VLAATPLLRKRPISGQCGAKKPKVSARNDKAAAAHLGQNMVDNTPEQLWHRIVRENPRASDEDIRCQFIAALIDDEDLRLQIIERFFKDIRKRVSN
jgi:hypothetical protein